MITMIAFYLFAAILIASAAMVVSARNPVHSVLFLILAFFNAAGLFLLNGAEFLAMILVIVYVGAVAVLFLFVVMMLDVNFVELREGIQRYAPIGAVVGLILFAELLMVVGVWHFSPAISTLRVALTPMAEQNTAALGDLLYTHYILLFQIAGLVLLVAMIGAIVLTLRERTLSRHQVIARQIARSPDDTLELVSVALNAGIPAASFRRPLADPLAEQPQEHDDRHPHIVSGAAHHEERH
jgi:NADH-quinone oxidoreductase subunit J